ncbi:hypothetical protein RI129_003411 [Pyrocoelia pectoralis]|uniref:Uncharacterized protein n=1 Tax=Pyrocoelia pectoralis TaxID=417401 RepID=A0AAN7VPB2_9COLE
MLFKPVYLKPKMIEAPIIMGSPPQPAPNIQQEQDPEPEPEPEPQHEPLPESSSQPEIPTLQVDLPPQVTQENLPILAYTKGIHVVYPTEARRDVLAGRVAYIYIDEMGSSLFQPKHIFNALKLNKDQKSKYVDYCCIGGRQRALEQSTLRKRQKNYVSTLYI